MEFEPVYDIYEDESAAAVIKVIGVGGGGGNAIDYMIENMLTRDSDKVHFYSVNTDLQALRKSKASKALQIGVSLTKGLGAGANPNIGRGAAEENRDMLKDMIVGADMVFITAGMGGGTGTGAVPVIAEVSKELGVLTVAVVTKPFSWEGKKRMFYAEQGIRELSKYVDSVITIPNEKLLKVLGKNITLLEAFDAANNVLNNAVRGISDMIISPGYINVDFADVRTVMSEMGNAMMGSGIGKGEPGCGRAEQAANDAIASPLLEDIDLTGAKGVLVNITSGNNLALNEFYAVGDTIKTFASEEATVVVGTTLVPEMDDEIRVTIVATGIGGGNPEQQQNVTLQQSNSNNNTQIPQSPYPNPNINQNQPSYADMHNYNQNQRLDNNNSSNLNDDDCLDKPAIIRSFSKHK